MDDGPNHARMIEVDARGLLCPLPVLRARKRLASMTPGQILCLLATDPMAEIDIPHFCAEEGHVLLSSEPGEGGRIYRIRRGQSGGQDASAA